MDISVMKLKETWLTKISLTAVVPFNTCFTRQPLLTLIVPSDPNLSLSRFNFLWPLENEFYTIGWRMSTITANHTDEVLLWSWFKDLTDLQITDLLIE